MIRSCPPISKADLQTSLDPDLMSMTAIHVIWIQIPKFLMSSCPQILGLDFTGSWPQEDWPGWSQMGVQVGSVCREASAPIWLSLSLGAVGSQVLIDDSTRTIRETH